MGRILRPALPAAARTPTTGAELAAAGYELHTAARRMEELYDKLGGRA